MENIMTFPNVIRTLVTGFLVLIMLRVVSPITTIIFGFTWNNTLMYVSAQIIYYLIIIGVCFFLVPSGFFEPKKEEIQ